MNNTMWMSLDVLALGCAALAAVLYIVRCIEVSRTDKISEPAGPYRRRDPLTIVLILAALLAVALGILRMFAAVM